MLHVRRPQLSWPLEMRKIRLWLSGWSGPCGRRGSQTSACRLQRGGGSEAATSPRRSTALTLFTHEAAVRSPACLLANSGASPLMDFGWKHLHAHWKMIKSQEGGTRRLVNHRRRCRTLGAARSEEPRAGMAPSCFLMGRSCALTPNPPPHPSNPGKTHSTPPPPVTPPAYLPG